MTIREKPPITGVEDMLGTWSNLIPILNNPDAKELASKLAEDRKTSTVYPESKNVFRAFKECPKDKLKVIILADQPYLGYQFSKPKANGLAYSYERRSEGDRFLPNSLKIVLTEVENDIFNGYRPGIYNDTDLTRWAKQGVLLLNTTLTTSNTFNREKWWKPVMIEIIKEICKVDTAMTFMLWGAKAQEFRPYIDDFQNVLIAGNPISEKYRSMNMKDEEILKGEFYGCKHFSQANKHIEMINGPEEKIIW